MQSSSRAPVCRLLTAKQTAEHKQRRQTNSQTQTKETDNNRKTTTEITTQQKVLSPHALPLCRQLLHSYFAIAAICTIASGWTPSLLYVVHVHLAHMPQNPYCTFDIALDLLQISGNAQPAVLQSAKSPGWPLDSMSLSCCITKRNICPAGCSGCTRQVNCTSTHCAKDK